MLGFDEISFSKWILFREHRHVQLKPQKTMMGKAAAKHRCDQTYSFWDCPVVRSGAGFPRHPQLGRVFEVPVIHPGWVFGRRPLIQDGCLFWGEGPSSLGKGSKFTPILLIRSRSGYVIWKTFLKIFFGGERSRWDHLDGVTCMYIYKLLIHRRQTVNHLFVPS